MGKVGRICVGIVAVAALVLAAGQAAYAHHVFLHFHANGSGVPGGGDPDGEATGEIDFESSVSPDVCLEATASGLLPIKDVRIVKASDLTVLLDFGDSLSTCVAASDEVRDTLHDHADEYLLLIATAAYEDGAVAGPLEEEHDDGDGTTTTTAHVATTTTAHVATTTTAVTPAAAAAAPVAVAPALTG